MHRRLAKLFAAGSALGVLALVCWSHPAGADVVTPPGACVGTAKWQGSGQNESSANHATGDVITIPEKDTVDWTGGQAGFAPGQQGPLGDRQPPDDARPAARRGVHAVEVH